MTLTKKLGISFIAIIALTFIIYYSWDYYNNKQEGANNNYSEDSLKELDAMDTITIQNKHVEDIEKKYGQAKVDQFAGNYYIDKEAGYMFEVDDSRKYKLQYNFEKKIKPDDPLLRCSPGKNIYFEITEVQLQKGMGIDDYINKWCLPGLYNSGKYPKVDFNYETQTATFKGEFPSYKQQLYSKYCLKGERVIACVLRYDAKDADNEFVKALSKSVAGIKLIEP